MGKQVKRGNKSRREQRFARSNDYISVKNTPPRRQPNLEHLRDNMAMDLTALRSIRNFKTLNSNGAIITLYSHHPDTPEIVREVVQCVEDVQRSFVNPDGERLDVWGMADTLPSFLQTYRSIYSIFVEVWKSMIHIINNITAVGLFTDDEVGRVMKIYAYSQSSMEKKTIINDFANKLPAEQAEVVKHVYDVMVKIQRYDSVINIPKTLGFMIKNGKGMSFWKQQFREFYTERFMLPFSHTNQFFMAEEPVNEEDFINNVMKPYMRAEFIRMLAQPHIVGFMKKVRLEENGVISWATRGDVPDEVNDEVERIFTATVHLRNHLFGLPQETLNALLRELLHHDMLHIPFNVLEEFMTLVEEYNIEWAIGMFDWNEAMKKNTAMKNTSISMK